MKPSPYQLPKFKNESSTRYPDEFEVILEQLDKSRTETILNKTKRTFTWLEKKLERN